MIATQNPIEYEGTYPLPEAQLDRFLFKLQVQYPTAEQEVEMLARHDAGLDPHDLAAAGVRAVASRCRPRRRPGGDPPDPRRPGDPAVHRGAVPGDARIAGAAARRVAARRDVDAPRVQGVGVAERAQLRHPGRGQGRRQAVPASPHRVRPDLELEGTQADARDRRHPRHRADAALMA